MPIPGYPLAADKANATLNADDHPEHHNALATAANALSDVTDAHETRLDAAEPAIAALDTRLDAAEASILALDPPWVFRVSEFGAVGDNVTNDRDAIQLAINTAAIYATGNEFYAEVWFDPKTYYIGSAAPTQRSGTSANGNWGQYAMLALPEVDCTGRKLVLPLIGTEAGDGMLHWEQATPFRSGTVIRANPTGLTSQTINGISVAPSMIGTPLHATGNKWSNLYAVIKGMTLQTPENTPCLGWDFKECANAGVEKCGAMVSATVGGLGGNPTIGGPTDDLHMALRMPELGNNDLSYADSFTVEGWYYGIAPGDHFHGDRIALIYCAIPIFIGGSGAFEHGATFINLSIEASSVAGIQAGQSAGFSYPLFIAALHQETAGGVDFDDAGGGLKGEVHWHSINQTAPTGNAPGLRIVNERMPRGAKTGTVAGVNVPSVPASTVALVNPYWRDAMVCIAGGTVSAISVDGTATGLTTTGHCVLVPTGKTIAITYSVAPTWTWTLL